MKTIEEYGEQGDVMFTRVERVPDGFTAEPETATLVVARSETGHHHVATGRTVRYTRAGSPRVSYVEKRDDVLDVEHHRPWDTHETLRLLGGVGTIWEIRRQREANPWGDERTVQD